MAIEYAMVLEFISEASFLTAPHPENSFWGANGHPTELSQIQIQSVSWPYILHIMLSFYNRACIQGGLYVKPGT